MRTLSRGMTRSGRDYTLKHGLWFRFEDQAGQGWAQPDLILWTPEAIRVFECKLSRHPAAEEALAHLYGPLLAALFPARPQVHISVFRNAGREPLPDSERVYSLAEVLELAPGEFAEWHWTRA